MCFCANTLPLQKQHRQQTERVNSPGDLVAQRLAGDDGDLLTHPLVGVEVIAQACVVFLNDDPGGLLDGLGPDATLRREEHNPSVSRTQSGGGSSCVVSGGLSLHWSSSGQTGHLSSQDSV